MIRTAFRGMERRMGYWGSGLYANDTGMDVRDTYMDLLQDGMDDETAWNTMLKKFSEYINRLHSTTPNPLKYKENR